MFSRKKIASILVTIIVAQIISCAMLMTNASTVYGAEPSIDAVSAILMEASTGQVIYEKNADEALHPASVTKIMTLLLIFDALKEGKITLEEEVTVSEHAASMGGSQVYLEVGEKQTVNTMIKCICVASANDASVAMAEHICGAEEVFVDKMNERAKGLGMNNSHFDNCCGLDVDTHKTSARDIALMSRELITKYPQIHEYSTIWMDEITHVTRKGESMFGLSNTNKLIKQYEWATGLKTGSTSLAKCCLSATAYKDGVELIAVIMAAPNSKTRFADATTLLNYGFGVVNIYKDDAPLEIQSLQVKGGTEGKVPCKMRDAFSFVFTEKIDTKQITRTEEYMPDLEAPISEGDVVGQVTYSIGNNIIGTMDVVACGNVSVATWKDYATALLMKMLPK